MKTLIAERIYSHSDGRNQPGRSTHWRAGVLAVAAAVLLVPAAIPVFGQQAAQPSSGEAAQAPADKNNATCIIGLEHIKHNARGKLTVEADALQFVTEKGTAKIPIASIEDLFAGKDDQQVFHGLGGTAIKAGVPYEGGRVLSLFSRETGTLTVQYRDSNGGLHGAIFVLAKGQGTVFKRQCVAKGAKASTPAEEPEKEEKKP